MSKFRLLLVAVTICTVIISPIFGFVGKVKAAAVAVTVSAPTNAEFAALTATNVTFGYNASTTEFASGNTISIAVSPTLAGALTDCTAATTDADGDATPDGAFGSFTTSGAVYTFTASTTTAVSGGIDLCLRFAASTTTGIYSISVTDTNDSDFGAALVYVGDDNDVLVTAQVTPILSMAIRNSADNADTNECSLGNLQVVAVNTCLYRVKVNTNANLGYTVSFLADGDLRKSGSGDVADSEDLDPIAENSTVSAGTENYGIAFNGGAATVGTITESGNFNDDDTPVPFVQTNLYTSNGPNNPGATDTTNTALVTHRATIDAGTETGNYSQIVTYYTVANF